MIKKLETERLILRKLKEEDRFDVFEYRSDPEVNKYVAWKRHKTIEDTIDYINEVKQQYKGKNPYVWAIELKENHKMIGTMEIAKLKTKYNWCELDANLNRGYWNKGYVTESLKAIMNFIFMELNLNKIQARCYANNIGSYKIFEKVGMVYEGIQRQHLIKNGVYHDLLRYSILKKEYLKNK